MLISVVTTLYYSENYIREFVERIEKVFFKREDLTYEILFVNDGSPDNSVSVIKTLMKFWASYCNDLWDRKLYR